MSAKQYVGYYEMKKHKPFFFIKDAQNYLMKRNELNCNGYSIQAK
jgi:hypothetical protein